MSLNVARSHELIQAIAQTTFLSSFKKGFDVGSKHFEYFKNAGDVMCDNVVGIIEFTNSGFDVNMNKMVTNKQYVFSFEDSKYLIWKNTSDELVLKEIL